MNLQETSSSEVVMVVSSWFLQKTKTLTDSNLSIKRQGTDNFIILRRGIKITENSLEKITIYFV